MNVRKLYKAAYRACREGTDDEFAATLLDAEVFGLTDDASGAWRVFQGACLSWEYARNDDAYNDWMSQTRRQLFTKRLCAPMVEAFRPAMEKFIKALTAIGTTDI